MADQLAFLTSDQIDETRKAFIEAQDMFFIATADESGAPQCSHKGGEPGFVRVSDSSTIAFPVYNGNGMYLTAGNIMTNSQVGMLFLDLGAGTRLRLNGIASVDSEDPLVDSYPGAQFVVRVRAKEVFANCRRYVHRYELAEHSAFVPAADHPSAPAFPEF